MVKVFAGQLQKMLILNQRRFGNDPRHAAHRVPQPHVTHELDWFARTDLHARDAHVTPDNAVACHLWRNAPARSGFASVKLAADVIGEMHRVFGAHAPRVTMMAL